MSVTSSTRRAPVLRTTNESGAPSQTALEAAERRFRRAEFDLTIKRLSDLAVASFLLVLFSPVFLLVAVAVSFDGPGGLFYRSKRVGQHGRVLSMLKFRKMRRDAVGPRLTVADDVRLTRVGRFLARTKLDELPQLWHVLNGEMSLVGPRPEDPYYVGLHEESYRSILTARPGITGLSQLAFVDEARVLGAGDPNAAYLGRLLPQKLALDRLYVDTRSIGRDLGILWWTVLAVVCRRPVAVHRTDGRLSLRRRPAMAHEPRSSRGSSR